MSEDTECDDYPPIRRLQCDATTTFLRAARSGNLEKVIEYLDGNLDINTANSNGLNALHLASKDGHLEIVTELLKRSAKVDAATKKGNTALHIASLAGQSEIVNILIDNGAAVNIQSQNGFTPLYMAAQENHDQVVKILLTNGANQSLATEDGFTPLAVAMQQGHDKVVSVLLENDLKGKTRLPALHIAAKKDDCKAADLLLQNDHKPDVTSKSGFTPLHIAAHYGNEEIARLLLKRGADVNYLARFNISPLHVAAKWGKNNMVKVLLEHGAMIDIKSRDGLTPLHCAARSGHEQCVTTLLESSAPISARSKSGLAPLHMASQGDHVDVVRALLYYRAPVDEVTIDYLTPLHVAAHCGHVRVAKLLLDRKADVNARALNGFTPLHIACKKNRFKVVELLVKYGASIESTTESGLTPLHVASFMGGMNIVIFLLQNEMNPDVPTVRGETPLHLAARANQTDIIRILLRNGAKVDAPARELQTPLHIASRLGNVDIVMLLLQHGAAVDTVTKDMYTALHMASKEGQEEVVAILVDNNASVKTTTKNGFTPLHLAAKYGNINVAKVLLQKNSRCDAQGKNNITPLLLACHYDHPNVAQLLLEKGASPHLASQNGQTPLHVAARKNQMDIASILLEHGAQANVESKLGFTPLHLSAQKGHYDMTNLLIEHGVNPNHKAKNGLTALHLCAQEDFIRVASILVKCGANVESETETGFRPIHMAAHFGNLSMMRFLLKHNADVDVKTKQNYTALHQAAQQGHAHIVSTLIESNASHRARTNDGLTALNIAQKLGYISVMEVLKGLSYDDVTPDNKNWEEKYKVIVPEILQETSLMSDSDDEGGLDDFISEQPYRYLTADLMKSLRDDSLPIDVTRDDPVHRQISKEEHQEFVQSNNYCSAENFDSSDFARFLVSFLVDARGGTMKGCRHSGIRLIVPPRRATMPIRVTCRLFKPSKMTNPPPLMEGESLATRVIEMGPVGASFLGPVLIDIPHFASVRDKEREIIVLRSENGETWKEHDNSADNDDTLLNTPYDVQMSSTYSGRITRIITTEFPQYFAIITRIKQEVHVIGAEGGILISSVANQVQAVFPPGALTKKIKVGLQAHVIPAELTAKLLGNCVAVSPVITIEPRRRKFHKPISLTLPVPQAANKGMINHYGGETPTLRLLCSIAGGTSEAQWEDVTGSTPLNFMNDRVSFTTTVSARFWLMDCRNIQEVPKMATDLYKESLYVPFITNFIIYSKRMEEVEATLRILCMTDSKDEIHTLEKQEEFAEIVKSRDVETLDGKDLYIEFSGNLVPVTKSGVQLKFTFKAFRQNRLSFHMKVKDPQLDPVARMMFMKEPKVAKGEPPQQSLCVLNIVLPEIKFKQKHKDIEDSNIISQKIDLLKSNYKIDYNEEKSDQPKRTSPPEKKFIDDTFQKQRSDAVDNLLAQKAQSATPLESVDACYSVQEGQFSSPAIEKITYSQKRRFWEDIARNKRESFELSDSDVSQLAQFTCHDGDNIDLSKIRECNQDDGNNRESLVDLDPIADISECTVAEKAHYFEEQIQKEITAARGSLKSQSSQESARIIGARLSGISISSEDDKSLESFQETERILEEKAKQALQNTDKIKTVGFKTWKEGREEKRDDVMEKGVKMTFDERKKLSNYKADVKELRDDKLLSSDEFRKKDDNRIGKDADLVERKKALKEENKDGKRKSKEGKDLFEKKQDYKNIDEQRTFKIQKDLLEIKEDVKEQKSEYEKRITDKNIKIKDQHKHVESSTIKKLKSDVVTKETVSKVNKKTIPDKVDLSDNEKIDKFDMKTKIATKPDIDKEIKAKVTKMQENVATKQQKLVGSQSLLNTTKSYKLKEETSPKSMIHKQKSKEETSIKPVLIGSKSKEEALSKSPPKKEKFKEETFSKSSPKSDKFKEEVLNKSSKFEKLKETISSKAQQKIDKLKDITAEKKDIKKYYVESEISEPFIQKNDNPEDNITLKSPQNSEKLNLEIDSLPKEEKTKEEISKSQIPVRQKSKEEFSVKLQCKDKESATPTLSYDISSSAQEKNTPLTEDKLKDNITANLPEKPQQDEQKEKKLKQEKPADDISKSMILRKEQSKEEFAIKYSTQENQEKSIFSLSSKHEIPKSMTLEIEKPKHELPLKSVQEDSDKHLSLLVIKQEKCIHEIPKPIVLQKEEPLAQYSLKSYIEDDKDKQISLTVTEREKSWQQEKKEKQVLLTKPKQENSTVEVLKSIIPQRENSNEGLALTTGGKIEDDISKSKIIPEEKSKDEISLKCFSEIGKDKQLPSTSTKHEISLDEIPKSIIPRREKSKDEFILKLLPQINVEEKMVSIIPKLQKSTDEIPKSIIPQREKSKEDFLLNFLYQEDKENKISSTVSKQEKFKSEIPKSMIPKRENLKEDLTLKSLPQIDTEEKMSSTSSEGEKITDEVLKSIIPRSENSKDELTIKSLQTDDKGKQVLPLLPERKKSTEELSKSMILKRENSKEKFVVKSSSEDNNEKEFSSKAPKREKSLSEIPKSIIQRREKSKDEILLKSVFQDDVEKQVSSTELSRENSITEISKSMLPRRENSKEEFVVKLPSQDQKEKEMSSIAPNREKSISEIPKSMIPRREKSKEEFVVKLPSQEQKEKEMSSSSPKREKSISETLKSMTPKREKSREEFAVKLPSQEQKEKEMSLTAPKREKSISEIPKSMIPRREKSKEEFVVKLPSQEQKEKEMSSSLPKREKSINEIPKSMIPKREKSREEFAVKLPSQEQKEKEMSLTAPKREKSISEIPKSMIPRREKSKEEFVVKLPSHEQKEKEMSSSSPKREKSISEIPKSMIPKREKSREEFAVKLPSQEQKKKEMSSTVPKREKSISEIPKSEVPRREKSKDEFSIRSSKIEVERRDSLSRKSKREKSTEELSKSMIPKREKSKEDFSVKSPINTNLVKLGEKQKSMVPSREKLKEEISTKSVPKREKSKEEISTKPIPKREKSKEEFSKSVPKREKSTDEIRIKPGRQHQELKEKQTTKLAVKKIGTPTKSIQRLEHPADESPIKTGTKRRLSKEEPTKQISEKSMVSSSKPGLSKEKCKEDTLKTSSIKRKEKDELLKQSTKHPGYSIEYDARSTNLRKDSSSSITPKKLSTKDPTMKKKYETVTVTKKESSAEMTMQEYEEHITKKTNESQLFLETLTNKEEDAVKLLEDTSALEKADSIISSGVITSTIDHKAMTSLEKKKVKSYKIDMGQEIIITHEENEDTQIKESSISFLMTSFPDEKIKEQESKMNEISTNVTHKTVVNLSDDFEIIETSASQIGTEKEESIKSRSTENNKSIVITKETSNSVKDNIVGASVKLVKDLKKENIDKGSIEKLFETSTTTQEILASSKTFDEKHNLISVTPLNESITINSSNLSKEIENENLIENVANQQKSLELHIKEIFSPEEDNKLDSIIEGKFISELSGARVLEILEPDDESVIKHDLIDISASAANETKFCLNSEVSPRRNEILHGSLSIDSLNSIKYDTIMSSPTLFKNTDTDYRLSEEKQSKQNTNFEGVSIKRRVQRDSFEIESPPLISPRSKIQGLEIKSVDWMIGDEKIEVSEQFQPCQEFEKEMDEYESMLNKESQASSAINIDKRKFVIPRIEKISSGSFEDSENIRSTGKSKFTVIPVCEQDIEIERELVENELDISCQELMDTLQREHDARTPRYSFTEEMYAESFHFRTVVDSEDVLNKDKLENLNLTDIPLETRTAVNVIEKEQFMSVDNYFEPIACTSKSNDSELLQLYEDTFEETLQMKNKNLEYIQNKEVKPIIKASSLYVESMPIDSASAHLKEESSEEIIDITSEHLDKKTLIDEEALNNLKKTQQVLEFMETSDDKMNNVSINENQLVFEDKIDKIVNLCDVTEIENADNKKNWSYNLQNFQKQPEPSELLLKMNTKKKDSEETNKDVQLLSYKAFDPEETKKHEESYGVIGIQKPTRTEFHKESKVDLRSKGWDDHKRICDKREKLHMLHQEISPYKIKKEDFQNVDMSARYGIKVLDQVVKKEIAEVKENLEAAKQDLIEELSENSENIIQIKDSPSEFQFKLQPESIPNELPFLYKSPSLEKISEVENVSSSISPIAKPRKYGEISRDREENLSESSSAEKKISDTYLSKTSIIIESESDKSSYKETKDIFESFSSSPKAASRSGSDAETTNKDDIFCLQPPQPVPRRRQKSNDRHRHVTSESEADISSSGESNYQSCEYETGSRPSSSDIEALQSAAQPSSTTISEYESAMMSFDHSSSKATSQDYYTAISSMSSRESAKSLNSLSSGQMGSIDSELSETLIASEPDTEEDEIDENLENILDDETNISKYASEEEVDKSFGLDPEIPCMMKRSSEMIFSQVINTEQSSEEINSDVKRSESLILFSTEHSSKSVSNPADFITCNIEASTIQTIPSQAVLYQQFETVVDPSTSTTEQIYTKMENASLEPDSLEIKYTPTSSIEDESTEDHVSNSGLTLQQQLSMTSSSMSGVSLETVIEKEHTDRNSDSDSFELVDKPDLIDDFIVVEEVGREAEEFDAEGKGVCITSVSHTSNKNFDREIENLITENQEAPQSEVHSARSNADLFDFESEESPPQASNDDQYSQSCSDDEQYNEGSKKWSEMRFQQNEAHFYEMEYERGPLEDIKEEEVTDFEAGSSRFGSMGSQKESIGSIGSMRGSFGSTPDNYEALIAKRYFKSADHDNLSLSSLQEFEHLENAVALENAKKREQQNSGSQDSSSNGSLPKRYVVSKSGHGDDISLSSVKDFEVLEKACKEAHMIELRAREEEDLLDHESPENRYKLESLAKAKDENQGSAHGSLNPSTSGSDDYEKRIKEIDEIIRLAQANVEKIDKQDDTTEDVSQMELTDTGDKSIVSVKMIPPETSVTQESVRELTEMNVMETSTDSLELEGNNTRNYNVMCRSSDSLELKTTLDYPSLSSDSLNNVKDAKEEQEKQFTNNRRISSDSLDIPVLESQETHKEHKEKDKADES